jgi:hypothetical protein
LASSACSTSERTLPTKNVLQRLPRNAENSRSPVDASLALGERIVDQRTTRPLLDFRERFIAQRT